MERTRADRDEIEVDREEIEVEGEEIEVDREETGVDGAGIGVDRAGIGVDRAEIRRGRDGDRASPEMIAVGRQGTAITPRRFGQDGQASVEWVGLVAIISAVVVAMALAGTSIPGTALVHSMSRSILCAVSLSGGCAGEGSPERTYGAQVAEQVRANAPDLLFGPDLLGLPVDFRTCRSPACADSPGERTVSGSSAGEPVTLFTRVIDCREGFESNGAPPAGCEASGDGRLYIQYWAYYPESASLRGVPLLEDEGYHPHDWESVQVRIDSDGNVDQRASSHAGYNHSRSAANWGSDMGWGLLRKAAEAAGLRERGGWGPATGRLLVAGGSHAGNVESAVEERAYSTRVPARKLRLVPLEQVRSGPLARPASFEPISPPWEKRVWTDPEAEGTG
jgi:hypothetical protein